MNTNGPTAGHRQRRIGKAMGVSGAVDSSAFKYKRGIASIASIAGKKAMTQADQLAVAAIYMDRPTPRNRQHRLDANTNGTTLGNWKKHPGIPLGTSGDIGSSGCKYERADSRA